MTGIPVISWRELTGNKFNKSLDSAMASDAGYIKTSYVRRTGDAAKTAFNVNYDREYLITFISKTICRPLFPLGKQRVLDLVDKAWVLYSKEKDSTAVVLSDNVL